MTTGIRSRVPAAEYFALPGVSITHLKEMRRSPQHYLYLLDHPKDTAPMRLGTATHTAVLEPERFEQEFVMWSERTPDGALRPRRGKDWTRFRHSNAGRKIITADEYLYVMDIQAAVRGNVARYLESGDPEVTMQWMLGDRECKGRVDWLTWQIDSDGNRLNSEHVVIVGLKTARDCRAYQFGAAAARLSYHLQWAWYFDGYRALAGHTPKMVEIVVESAPPHAIAVYHIPDDVIEQGREEYQKCLDRLTDCERTGHFPGPQEEEEPLSLPTWAYPSEEDLIELGLEP